MLNISIMVLAEQAALPGDPARLVAKKGAFVAGFRKTPDLFSGITNLAP